MSLASTRHPPVLLCWVYSTQVGSRRPGALREVMASKSGGCGPEFQLWVPTGECPTSLRQFPNVQNGVPWGVCKVPDMLCCTQYVPNESA